MTASPSTPAGAGPRILVVDDNPAIHEDFRKILCPACLGLRNQLDADEVALFGDQPPAGSGADFQVDSAFQGQEALAKARAAGAEGDPYSVAFLDVRMPPGWDGIETMTHLWKEFPDLQIVLCTAYSDYSWEEISSAVGDTDRVLVLKKPFDNIEVKQMANALSRKWDLTRIAQRQMADLDALVNQRTTELREANRRLQTEVAERAAAEEALRCSEERFSKAFHGSPVPMAIQLADGTEFLDANESFCALIGTRRESVLSGWHDFWADADAASQIRSELAARHTVRNLSTTIRTSVGDTREVLVAADNLDLLDRAYRLLILQDITDRVHLEMELRQAQKMEAVGRLAAGVAHDFNNLLTIVLGNATMQIATRKLDQDMAFSLDQIVVAAERASALTRQLLAYSRKQIIQRRSVSLNEIVSQTVSLLRRVIGEQIVIGLDLMPDLPPVFADPSSVDQVIMNLALNARDAMGQGGKLAFSTTVREHPGRPHLVSEAADPRRYACLAVTDTGQGMDEATLARIFEPFFTTKEPGHGTGMGLATVYGILRQHDGWIDVESKPGLGTEFRAYFPLVESSAADGKPESAGPLHRQGGSQTAGEKATILVVEDENMLREYVCKALGMLGYRVLSASNGHHALETWSRHRDQIDLLFTDVVMPESISGLELARQLSADRPDLKIIFTSGYSADLLGAGFEQNRDHVFLAKPFLTEQLAQVVALQLHSRTAG